MQRRATLRLFSIAVCCLLAACSPQDATPVPEPPALQPSKVSVPPSIAVTDDRVTLNGLSGAAPPRATIEVTALDSVEPPVATTVAEDGSFSVRVFASGEQRAVVIVDGRRSQPLDFSLVASQVVATARPDCLRVTPSLLGGAARGQTLSFYFANGCANSIAVSHARTRLMLASFTYDTSLALNIAPGARASVDISVSANALATDQEVLFVDATVDGEVVRYPLGVYVRE